MKKMLVSLASLLLLSLSFGLVAEESPYKEGRDYEVLASADRATDADKNVVQEFFWYGCPHCSQFEPHLERWLKTKPEHIIFQRVPAPLNPNWTPHSKAYYAAEMMGVLDQFHEPLFAAIHGKREKIFTESALIGFAKQQGIDHEAYAKAMNSFMVDANVRRARGLAKKYDIRAVPNVIVSGKYRLDASMAGGYDNLLKIVEYLIAKEISVEEP